MERHKCKLCTRTFANGRALGGHMKAHLATLPLPPKITTTVTTTHQQQLGFRTESSSSSYSSSGEEQDNEIDDRELDEEDDDKEKAAALAYRLRENPKKSFKFADPEFSFAVDAGSVVQDRESETESRNPTRRRSKRTRKSDFGDQNFDLKKLKPKVEEWPPSPPPLPAAAAPAAVTEPEPVSSVSDTSPEEDVAMCLMMLSRDVWIDDNDDEIEDEEEEQKRLTKNREKSKSIEMIKAEKEIKVSKIRSGKFRCEKCTKLFRSSPALLTHRKICSLNGTELGNERIFECPYCFKVFGSGQALGGHKRSHLRNLDSSSPSPSPSPPAAAVAVAVADTANANICSSAVAAAVDEIEIESCSKMENNWIDLNLPAPMEDDEFSMVSDCLI